MSASKDLLTEVLLTYRETAKILGVTERTLHNLVQRGDLIAVRFGRSVRFDPADLRAFIQRSKSRMGGDQ